MQTWTDEEIAEIRENSASYSPRLPNGWTAGKSDNSSIFVLANPAWWQTEGSRQMQCRHEILRHELLYAPSLFVSDPDYKISYIGFKAQNIYQELETCLKIIWFADNNIPVAAFFNAQGECMDVPKDLRNHYKFARRELGHKVKDIFDSISPVSQNMLRHAYDKIRRSGFVGILSEPRENCEDSLDVFLSYINYGRVPTNYFALEGLGKIPQSNLKLMLAICTFCRDCLGRKLGVIQLELGVNFVSAGDSGLGAVIPGRRLHDGRRLESLSAPIVSRTSKDWR